MKVKILNKDGYKIVDLNRRKAIREKCLNCSGWSSFQVMECKFEDCPLHPFRTGKGKQDSKGRDRAIKAYCKWCMGGNVREVAKCTATLCPLYAYRVSRVDRSVEVEPRPLKQAVNG